MSEELTPRRYVVAADFVSTTNKVCMTLIDVETGRKLIFERHKSMMVTGVIYEILTSADGTKLGIGNNKYIERSDDIRVAGWQAEQAAFKLKQREKSIQKKMETDDWALERHISALRLARDHLSSNQRLPFDLWLMSEIRK